MKNFYEIYEEESPENDRDEVIKNETGYDQKMANIGFKKIGDTELFRGGDFIIEQDGGTHRFFVKYLDFDKDNFRGIKANDDKNGKITVISHNKLTGSMETVTPRLFRRIDDKGETQELEEKCRQDINRQLLQAGFKNDIQGDKIKIFRLLSGKESSGIGDEVIAVVDNGRLVDLVKRIDDVQVNKHITPETEIIGISQEKNKSLRGDRSLLRLSNKTMEFTINSRGTLYGRKMLRELSDEELGVKLMDVIVEPSGFKIGGQNSSDLIKTLKSINGKSIEDLENIMHPCQEYTSDGAVSGFLGKDERLLDVLVQDNDYVLSRGMTHQELSVPFKYIKNFLNSGYTNSFQYKGSRYKIGGRRSHGSQNSPFGDNTRDNYNVKITNLDNGQEISASLLLADMIERYGFYEGNETPFRVAPEQIIKIFPYLSQQAQQRSRSAQPENEK